MTSLEAALLAVLGMAALFSWYYAIFVLGREAAHRNSATSDVFPVGEWEEISVHDLGKIEGNIQGLIRVIVPAHRVEEPSDALRQAVKKNLEAGVEYHFLVSKEHAESELDGWVLMFLSIARVVLKRKGSATTPDSLVYISNLSYSWRDTPYIFYQTETAVGQLATIAFRGNQVDEGIAERYTRLPGWLAYSLANAILSDAPHRMSVEAPQFNIVPDINPDILTTIGPKERRHAGAS